MLEDFTMEKKSGRPSQPPVKGNASESKKYPDTVGNKTFLRTSRRREPFNAQGSKNEASRKPLPQKYKSIDKRPRQRGQHYGCGKEDTKVADEVELEPGSVFVQGSKKHNLNHLLNFHYAPRDGINSGHQNWREASGGRGRNNSKWLMATHKHKYNKEQFLQANCQFVVKSTGNYSAYMGNPDMLVDWECIEQIRLRSSEMTCPICLYPPVAAKMTRCGHVFCWSCILHYLALSDKAWRKCPICFEAVHKQDLRSVVAVPHTMFSVGEEITLRLMKRKRGSLIALPVNQSEIHSSDKLLSLSEKGVDIKYSKLLLASTEEVLSIIHQERVALEVQLADIQSQKCPEACFVQEALELLKERAVTCSGNLSHPENFNGAACSKKLETDDNLKTQVAGCGNFDLGNYQQNEFLNRGVYNVNDSLVPEMESGSLTYLHPESRVRYESMSSEGLDSEDGNIAVEDIETLSGDNAASAVEAATPKDFYFYQASDGQHIYLHALNVRMLEYLYGSLKNSPLSITGRIIEKESGSMTDELRQRLRYLQHLPVTCQFEVAEILLKPPIVNRETIEYFWDQLETRKRRRQRRARDERKREKRINDEEKKLWGRYPSPHIAINSHQHFPIYSGDMENTGSSVSASSSSTLSNPSQSLDEYFPISTAMENLTIDEVTPGDDNFPAITENSESPPGPSFAQMLRDGKSKSFGDWPSVIQNSRSHKEMKTNMNPSDSESDCAGFVQGRPYQVSFSSVIAEAMEKAAAASASSKDDLQDHSGHVGKKKKKKQKLLFATGFACKSK